MLGRRYTGAEGMVHLIRLLPNEAACGDISQPDLARFPKVRSAPFIDNENNQAGHQALIVSTEKPDSESHPAFVRFCQRLLNCALPSFSLSSGFFGFQSLHDMSHWMINGFHPKDLAVDLC